MAWLVSQLIWFGCTAVVLLIDASRRSKAATASRDQPLFRVWTPGSAPRTDRSGPGALVGASA